MPLDGIVNQARHDAVAAASSKYPPAFGIDLLVDNAEGVSIEGKRLGFAVLIVDERDTSWCSRVDWAVREAEMRQ